MTLKAGDLIVIENTDKLSESISQFYKKWETAMATGMPLSPRASSSAVGLMAFTATETVIEKQTGKQVKLKYRGLGWKPFENKRLIGIVTEITEEEHRDFDMIKIREQTGGFRYCRRCILENV